MKVVGKVPEDHPIVIEHLVRMCMVHLSKEEYGMNLPNNAIDRAVELLTVKYLRKGTPSRAGASCIRINTCYWQVSRKIHTEYRSYNSDPVIGQIDVGGKWLGHMMVTVAHEVAHHVQYRYYSNCSWLKPIYRKPHGDGFKAVYRILRRDLVNPFIKAMLEDV